MMKRRTLLTRSAATLGGLITTSLLHSAASWAEGASVPDLSSYGLEGKLPKLAGKVVYLDFWASWCAPCKASFPVLNAWYEKLGPQGLVVLGVNVDESAEAMTRFLEKNQVSFPVVRDAAQKLVAAANVSTMPTSFIIDRRGVIQHVHTGFRAKDEASLAAKLQSLLG